MDFFECLGIDLIITGIVMEIDALFSFFRLSRKAKKIKELIPNNKDEHSTKHL